MKAILSPSSLVEDYLEKVAANVSALVAPDDHMFGSALESYLGVGRSAMRNIAASLIIARRTSVGSVLDFGCGAGRVARWLRAGFPDAELTVADIRSDWVDFCAANFAAKPFLSDPDLGVVKLTERYDLIWVGSLLTHLPEEAARHLLDALHASLTANGVLVFTLHGRRMLLNQLRASHNYIEPSLFPGIATAALIAGYGFSPHVTGRSTGISLSSTQWVCRWCGAASDRKLLAITESGWDEHQDVAAISRSTI